ncbi:hypothetical protein RXV86_15925 [Alisedimentitalea sp. MJ-SS2]|uniref:hypothetical protein n=1 Tax=Aliisedimentitalea sp. MJ-SS2 TaxID=3049795 RepID=UPI00290726F1|nr:hypothetical protein [Alisedimentitalea sp. MJ-SS2]MDU8928881.1 hypothetical protein [Alisedimentitalea sp. MJ-SS2]
MRFFNSMFLRPLLLAALLLPTPLAAQEALSAFFPSIPIHEDDQNTDITELVAINGCDLAFKHHSTKRQIRNHWLIRLNLADYDVGPRALPLAARPKFSSRNGLTLRVLSDAAPSQAQQKAIRNRNQAARLSPLKLRQGAYSQNRIAESAVALTRLHAGMMSGTHGPFASRNFTLFMTRRDPTRDAFTTLSVSAPKLHVLPVALARADALRAALRAHKRVHCP